MSEPAPDPSSRPVRISGTRAANEESDGRGPTDESGGETAATAPGRPGRPVTGDRAVDDALASFDRSVGDGPTAQAEAAAEAHRALQSRLTAPAPPVAAPGEARPGPRR